MKAALYTRVSTDIQVEEGFSLDAQLSRLRAYCESQGWDIYDIFTDEGESAKNTVRPGLQRMLQHVRENRFDVVLVYKLDRLTRNVVDLHGLIQEFEKYGVAFKSATEVFDTTSAMGRLFITIVAALAQWERENLAERTRMGQVEKVQQGKRPGANAPFGYRYEDRQLVPDEPKAEVVRGIFRRYLLGDGLAKILKWLNHRDAPQLAPISGRWTQNVLRYLLDNPVYAGYIRYGYGYRSKGETVLKRGEHEPLIDEDTWNQAQLLRKQRTRVSSRSGTGTYPLTGLLRCGLCGSSLSGMTKYRSTKAEGDGKRYYVCVERVGSRTCALPYIQEKDIDEAVLQEIEKRFARQKIEPPNPKSNTNKRKRSLEAELAKIKQKRDRWKDAYENGLIEASEMRERLDVLQEQEITLRAQVDDEPDMDDTKDVEIELLSHFRTLWENGDVQEKRQAASLLLRTVIVFSPDEVSIQFV